MALRNPPPSVPGAGVSCVSKFQSRAANPLENKTTKIHNNTVKPKPMASMEVTMPQALAKRRRRYKASFMFIAMSEPLGFFSPVDHDFGEGQDHESDHEQQKAEREK